MADYGDWKFDAGQGGCGANSMLRLDFDRGHTTQRNTSAWKPESIKEKALKLNYWIVHSGRLSTTESNGKIAFAYLNYISVRDTGEPV